MICRRAYIGSVKFDFKTDKINAASNKLGVNFTEI